MSDYQLLEDRIIALEARADVSPEMMGAITKSVSKAHHDIGETQSLIESMLDRIEELEDAQPSAVTLEPIIEDRQAQDLNILELEESARNMAGLFLTLVSAGATPQQAADMATTWLILQETGNE